MKTCHLIIVLCFIIWSPELIFSQGFNPKFTNITVEDGLTQNTVTNIIQDYDGFMWFATEDGLNRFDGVNMANFREIPIDTSGLTLSRVSKMKLFRDSVLWLRVQGADFSYSAYHKSFGFMAGQQFFPKLSFDKCLLNDVLLDKKNRYWLSLWNKKNTINSRIVCYTKNKTYNLNIGQLGNGKQFYLHEDSFGFIWLLNGDKKVFKLKIESDSIKIVDEYKIQASTQLFQDHDNHIFIVSTEGLLKYNFDKNSFECVLESPSGERIYSVFLDSENNLWGGYGEKSFFYYKDGQIQIKEFEKHTYLNDVFIRSIIEDSEGRIWLGTSGNGIYIYNKDLVLLEHIEANESNMNELSHPYINQIYKDSENNLWIGTLEKGISMFSPSKNRFTNYSKIKYKQNGLTANIVRSFEESSNKIWMATRGGGISVLDKSTHKFSAFFNNDETHCESLYNDGDSILWIGTRNKGVFKYDIKNQKLLPFKINSSNTPSGLYLNYIRKIYSDSKNNLWFCTWAGLIKMDSTRRNYKHFFSDSEIIPYNVSFTICEYTDSTYLVGSEGGMTEINAEGEVLNKYLNVKGDSTSLSNNTVFNIQIDSKKRIWVGTFGGGLNLFNPVNNTFKHYHIAEGLPNSCVYGILEDKSGNLWISTNNGLSCFNPEKETFRNFYKTDGLPSSAFNFGAYFIDDKDNFWFGTEEGVVTFQPQNVIRPKVNRNRMQILNVTIFGAENGFADYIKSRRIILDPDQHVVKIDFVLPSFAGSEKIEYQYKIEKLQKQWISNQNNQSITLSNLPFGRYIFKIRALNNGIVIKEPISIPLLIKAHFVDTTYFKLLLVAVCFIILFLVFQVRIYNLKRMQKMRLNIANDLHDEIGSSLSAISFQGIQLAKKSEDIKEVGEKVTQLSKNTASSIRDIVWFINPENDDIGLVIYKMKTFAKTALPELKIDFNISGKISEPIDLSIKRNLFAIFKELLTNIAKHSGANEVLIQLRSFNHYLILSVSDNGSGFESSAPNLGMGLKSMNKRTKEIKAIFKIKSKSTGTQAILKIPIRKKWLNWL